MTARPPLDVAEFAAFFRAVHGHDPFPWQVRLSQLVAETGWPDVLDLPTGSGKTAALDVAVFTLALDAGRAPRSAPLRIVYVVDRRTIVDQAYTRAQTIKQALARADEDVIRRVRDRLAGFTHEGIPLRTALLRGGIARADNWARTPDQPLIVVSTVDQVGSRILFRGYGVSDSMKPVHAGLLGCDVLYLLDEVHLSQPFRETLAAISTRYRTWAERPILSPFVSVAMSATPGSRGTSTFALDGADRLDARLSVRLKSSKPAALVSTNARGFSNEVAKHVTSMLARPGATIAVVVNRVNTARDLHARLAAETSAAHLLTGRMRPFDRDALERSLLERIRAGRTRSPNDQPIVIVATQSIEAGADFDFDGLVTECASLDALRQRFGRLDRLGELAGSASGVIVARTDALKDDPVYGDAIGKTWAWLQEHGEKGIVDFGVDRLLVPPDAEELGLLAPRAHAPILLPSHLDAWAQTAPIPDPDPDVALWLHGPKSGAADVQIVWRADVTEDLLRRVVHAGREAKEAEDFTIGMVEALPPVSAEAMAVPFVAAKRWLEGRPEPSSADVEGAADTDQDAPDPRPESVPRPAIVWQGDQSMVIAASDLRPGQTIVVPSAYGGIDHHNWAPASNEPVRDVADLAAFRQRGRPTLRVHEAVLQGLFGQKIHVARPTTPESEGPSDRDTVGAWLQALTPAATDSRLRELIDGLRQDAKWLRVDRLPLASDDNGEYFIVTGRRRRLPLDDDLPAEQLATTEDVKSSFTGVDVPLADHLAGVAETAAGVAERVGLAASLVADLRLAGHWHDAGKADARFQRWLHGGSEYKALIQRQPLAKSRTRVTSPSALRVARERAGYPAGGRHELTSLVLLQSAADSLATRAEDWTLVHHLITCHHGFCRPLAPWVPDPNPIDVTFSRDGIACVASSAHDLARLDSGVAERFWQMVRMYGWWGLAWLEALLRLADHRQSEREQYSKEKRDA